MKFARNLSALAVVGALFATVPAQADDIQDRVIRFGYFVNNDHPVGFGVRKFGELVAERSGGKIQVREFPSSQLGNENQQQSALIAGTQEMAAPGSPQLVGAVKEFGLLDFPYLVSTREQAHDFLDGPFGQALLDRLPQHGIVGMGYWENGFRHVTNSRRPVKGMDDLAGLKIRVQLNPVFIETFQALGTNPIPLSFSELYSALETKTIDAQENPLPLIVTSRFAEVQSYVGLTGHVYGNNIVLMSKVFWDSLSDTEKTIISESMDEAIAYQREISAEQLATAVDELTKAGMQVDDVSDEEKARMRAVLEPVTAKFLPQYDQDVVELFNSELERINAGQ